MTEIDKVCGVGAKPKHLPDSSARMRHVAKEAGVSVATVSNVINHPHLVAARTRERVHAAVLKLGFQPNPHAKALQGGWLNNLRAKARHVLDCTPDSQQARLVRPVNDVAQAGSAPVSSGLDPEVLIPRKHLSFRVGPEFLSGIVEAVMPDKSCFWIWADRGMGRRLI